MDSKKVDGACLRTVVREGRFLPSNRDFVSTDGPSQTNAKRQSSVRGVRLGFIEGLKSIVAWLTDAADGAGG
jgi:hypothetical protein